MTITLNISVEQPGELIHNVLSLAVALGYKEGPIHTVPATEGGPGETAKADPAPEPVAEPKPKGRRKAPAADAVLDQPVQIDIEEVTGKAGAMLTIEEVREKTRQWSKDGFMDEVAAEMGARGIKKMSEIDPEHDGKPSAKFAGYCAAIEARIAGKPVDGGQP